VVARTARQALQEQRYDQGDQLLPKPLGRIYRFLDDGRLCMSNNAAERELRAVAVGRRNWTFAGSGEGGRRAAAIYTLIATAKLNDIHPKAWLADVLARLPDHPARRLHELLPWNWRPQSVAHAA
jgi:transposase